MEGFFWVLKCVFVVLSDDHQKKKHRRLLAMLEHPPPFFLRLTLKTFWEELWETVRVLFWDGTVKKALSTQYIIDSEVNLVFI